MRSRIVKIINGVTFLDPIALEKSLDKSTPLKHLLREKMMNAGVEFWNDAKTVVKKPVIAISTIGGFPVNLEGDIPDGMIKLTMGKTTVGPMTPADLMDSLRLTMGMQSTHTYMNPQHKTERELYDATVEHGHFSMAHSVSLGMHLLGISKKAEMEFDVQRDQLFLARETSARCGAQDQPVVVALTAQGAILSEKVQALVTEELKALERTSNAMDWREERNALQPLSACVSLGITGTVRSFQKVMSAISDAGKEVEFRNALALMNDSLHGLFPEIFKATKSYGFEYPSAWQNRKSFATLFASPITAVVASTNALQPKRAILFLGAPGVGKSTQTEFIVRQLPGVMCVSTGNLVRKLNQKVKDNLPLNAVEQYAATSLEMMRQGKLMDDKAVYSLLMVHLSPGGEGYDEYMRSHTVILDGVIKERKNIEAFESALEDFNTSNDIPMSLKEVINISTSFEELIERQKTRVAAALLKGIPQRPDDDAVIYHGRLTAYMETTKHIIDYYQQNANYKFVEVDASQESAVTSASLMTAIQYQLPENREISRISHAQ